MKLTTLLQCLNIYLTNADNIVINTIQLDSRKVEANDLFIAIPGSTTDGRQYISQAIANGAVAVLVEAPFAAVEGSDVPIIVIAGLSKRLGILAGYFYDDPSYNMHIVGVTGTNGKSSICHYIAEILHGLSSTCATIGTLGLGTTKGYVATDCTTPDAVELQKNLAALRKSGIRNIAMEVSSHALVQNRVVGVKFHTAVFTNLTQDHLDYHHTMLNYWEAKLKFFLDFAIKQVVINLDDPYGRQLLAMLPHDVRVISYTLNHQREITGDFIIATNIQYTMNGITTKLISNYGEEITNIPLLGSFNLSNMLAAIAAVMTLGYSLTEILTVVPKIHGIPGRMQQIQQAQQPLVVVDYAHTPDALARVLETLRYYCRGKLWCVFGCGGNRDRGKRAEMLKIAVSCSNHVILTQDNPRTEDPQQIIGDTVQGHTELDNVVVEMDRRTAIEMAVTKAAREDVILVAGKGHEDHQIIGTTKISFSDVDVVNECMKNKQVARV